MMQQYDVIAAYSTKWMILKLCYEYENNTYHYIVYEVLQNEVLSQFLMDRYFVNDYHYSLIKVRYNPCNTEEYEVIGINNFKNEVKIINFHI